MLASVLASPETMRNRLQKASPETMRNWLQKPSAETMRHDGLQTSAARRRLAGSPGRKQTRIFSTSSAASGGAGGWPRVGDI